MDPRDRLVVALDVDDLDRARILARTLARRVGLLKVGLELFTLGGPAFVREVVDAGCGVFLDLKLHDIPHTVGRAAARAAALGVRLMTVHAAGGAAMIAAAARGARAGTPAGSEAVPRVLAVTVLTSLDASDLARIGLRGTPAEAVTRLAELALEAGADGLVTSPLEVRSLRQRIGSRPILLTPGIRPEGEPADDQKRTLTPAEAVAAGADYLVVGRPILRADDPAARAAAIVASLDGKGRTP